MSLSERIAALNARSTNPSPSKGVIQVSSTVKDKAARFDGLGPAPAPRGSFGLGAPPSSGPKRNNELYGNRISSFAGGSLKASGDPNHHSRASSIASDRPSSRNEIRSSSDQALLDAHPINRLTTEAVESLGTATFSSPSTAHQRPFHSVAPSEASAHDVSSSVAVEVDDVGISLIASTEFTTSGEGRASPAMTHSTVSDSAMREAPPLLTPAPVSPHTSTPPASASQDGLSIATTQDSVITVPSTTPNLSSQSEPHLAFLAEGISGLQVSDTSPSPAPLSTTPLPLSAALVESLESKDRPTPATPRSVVVEAGSDVGDDLDPDGMQGTSPNLFTEDSDRPQPGSENDPSGEPIEVDLASNDGDLPVQPDLDIPAVVAPLSSMLLNTLNLSSSTKANPASRTGYDTPYSTCVEDGSVDGRTLAESDQDMALAVDEEYIDPKGPNEMDPLTAQPAAQTPVEVALQLPPLIISSPPSPAVLAYDPTTTLLTPTTPPARHDSEALVNIGELASSEREVDSFQGLSHPTQHSASPSADSQINTPLATRVALPEPTPTTSRGIETTPRSTSTEEEAATKAGLEGQKQVQEDEYGAIDSAFPLPKFSMSHDIDVSADGRQDSEHPLTLEDSPLLPEEVNLPYIETRLSYDQRYLRASSPSPCSSPSNSRPASANLEDTLNLIKSFPSIPPMRQPPSIFIDKPLPSPPVELPYLSPSPMSQQPTAPIRNLPSRPTSTTREDTFIKPPVPLTVTRRHSTDNLSNSSKTTDPSLPLPSTGSTTVRRSISSSAVKRLSSNPRKKPQLIPGAWITDDDMMDEDFEPGWASITVSKYQYR